MPDANKTHEDALMPGKEHTGVAPQTAARETGASEADIAEALARARDGSLSEEQQKLLKEWDKESSTRTLRAPSMRTFFYLLCIAVTLYHFITSFLGTPVVLKHRSLHVAMMLVLGFIMYPLSKKSNNHKVPWYDWILIILSATVPLYVWCDYLGVVERAGMPNTTDMISFTR